MLLEAKGHHRWAAIGPRTSVLLAVSIALLAGCYHRRQVVEYAHPGTSGRGFNVFGLIGAEDTRFVGNVTTLVRMQLEKAGFRVLRTPGKFDSEQDAMDRLCEARYTDAVIFAKWDQVMLRSCDSGYPRVFEADGGGEIGAGELIKRLLAYLGPRDKDDKGKEAKAKG